MTKTLILTLAAGLTLAACAQPDGETAGADPSATEQAESGPSGGDMTPASVDVVEAASANENLSTFLEAATSAGLGETLAQADGVTIFAPINEAFESVEGFDQLRQDQEQLSSILQRHAVPTRYLSSDLPEGETEVETLSGEALTVINASGQVSVRTPGGTEAMVVEADIEGDNGVVHAINTVLAD